MPIRQAVVVVHGMGEQKPLDITRAFLRMAIPETVHSPDQFHSRPDKVSPSNSFDLRRFLVPRQGSRPQTEFYEYHWAHLMSGNKLSQLLPLLRSVLLRRFRDLGRLFPVWLLLVVLAAILGGVAAFLILDEAREVESWDVEGILTSLGAAGIVITIVGWLVKRLTFFLVGWFVDAARYWDAAPGNQKARNDIRSGLVELLDALHESGRYDRIILAAHSLGSCISYDAIGYLWARYNKLHKNQADMSYSALSCFEDAANSLVQVGQDSGATGAQIQRERQRYRKAQRNLWVEMRNNGNPWLITDFVSFGSPLAHSHLLITKNREALRRSVARKEHPSCPPQAESGSGPDRYHWCSEVGARLLHHGAPFAPVRWTNLYYDADSFGGDIPAELGIGVENLMIDADGSGSGVWLMAHTAYLKNPQALTEGGTKAADRFHTALELDATWIPTGCQAPDEATAGHTGGPCQGELPPCPSEETKAADVASAPPQQT